MTTREFISQDLIEQINNNMKKHTTSIKDDLTESLRALYLHTENEYLKIRLFGIYAHCLLNKILSDEDFILALMDDIEKL